MSIKVFWMEPTDRERRWLRRYTQGDHKCGSGTSYCNAMFELGEFDIRYTKDGYIDAMSRDGQPADNDPRWPLKCDACGHVFADSDPRQLFGKQIYVRPDNGFRCTTDDAPPGACWDAWWISGRSRKPTGCGYTIGPDHRSLTVKCPDGHMWMIDARASNCTMKDDNVHHCWVRHGKPEDGTLHVDKNGNTCAAGAGSIDTGSYHGFLHNGEFTQ